MRINQQIFINIFPFINIKIVDLITVSITISSESNFPSLVIKVGRDYQLSQSHAKPHANLGFIERNVPISTSLAMCWNLEVILPPITV